MFVLPNKSLTYRLLDNKKLFNILYKSNKISFEHNNNKVILWSFEKYKNFELHYYDYSKSIKFIERINTIDGFNYYFGSNKLNTAWTNGRFKIYKTYYIENISDKEIINYIKKDSDIDEIIKGIIL